MSPARQTRLVRVERVERPAARTVRLELGGELEDFDPGGLTDAYVKLQLPPPGASYSAPFDVEALRAELPREQWPRTRTYTVRSWDGERRRLTVDFVLHGDEGVAGPWAESAAVGDPLQLLGPGGDYAPDPEADWQLMVGDPSVVPAIAASLPLVPPGRPVFVVLQVEPEDDRPRLESPGELRLEWVEEPGPEPLLAALRRLELPAGAGQAFVHGEADAVRAARRHLVVERGFPTDALSASGYWRRSRSDEEWRAEKAEWKAAVEADAS